MVELTSLVLPILLSAIFVFVASSIIHMMLGYHKNDHKKVPGEDDVMAALRPFNIPPGDYMIPRPECHDDMKKAEYIEKAKKGTVAFMTVMPSGMQGMGKSLALWFLYMCRRVSLRGVSDGACRACRHKLSHRVSFRRDYGICRLRPRPHAELNLV